MSAPGGWERVRELFADIGGTYRPIPFSLFALYRAFDSNIYLMHWVPIFLHAINVSLVYLLTLRLTRSKLGAIAGSLVYGVSPIVFFDVFTLTGLVDQIFLLFSLGSLLLFQEKKVAASWGLFILAMFSKESFVSVLLIISYWLWTKRSSYKQWALYYLPTLIYFGLKLSLYRQQGAAYSYIINWETLRKNLFDYGLWIINWRHGWQIGMPYEPHRYYDLVSVAYAGMLGIAVAWSWKYRRRLFWLALWWGAVGLVPFYFLGRALPFYLEFSLIAVAILVAATVGRMKKPWLYAGILGGLSIYMSIMTKSQWIKYSFSARGVQAAEQYKREVIERYDWSKYDKLCLSGMGEYELWATGVGQLIRMMGYEIEVEIKEKCERGRVIQIRYLNESYHL